MVSPQLNADEATCQKVLHDCDSALQAEQKANELDKQIIADQDKRYQDQSSELRSEEFWRPIAYGAIAAALIEGLVLSFKH